TTGAIGSGWNEKRMEKMLTATDPRPDTGPPPKGATDSNPEVLLADAGAYLWLKAALDAVAALILLVLTAPLVLAAMLLIKLTSRGPAVYSQTRLGRNGRPFTIYKLRTMEHECESLTSARWSTPGAARVTPLRR